MSTLSNSVKDEFDRLNKQISLLKKANEILEKSLKESVKLQSHYANLLNMHDGGERMIFKNIDEWIERLEN